MPDFILADFFATGETWLANSPGVLALALFIAAVVAWIASVRWLENTHDLEFVRREIEREKREAQRADEQRQRKVYGAIHSISDRRK